MEFKIFYEELLYDIFYNSNKLNMQKSDIIQFSMGVLYKSFIHSNIL